MDYLCLTPEAGDFKKIGADGDYFTLLKRHIGNLTSNPAPRNLMTMNPRFLIFVKKQSQELTRVNPDRNIFSINVELTSTFLLYRGLVHQPSLNFKLT